MKFAIALFAPPHLPASRRALRFAESVLAGGHQIVRLFLYQDAIHTADNSLILPQDEMNWGVHWQQFIEQHQLDAVVCIAAALRRGLLDSAEVQRHGRGVAGLQAPWQLSGLGQLHDAAQQADRLVCFGGP